jgi:predicted PurR-regulated permease PerM
MSDPIKTPTPRRRFSKRTLFFGICAILLLCILAIAFSSTFSPCFAYLGGILSPILIGCVIAYLCNPILKFYEYVVFHKLRKGNLKSGLSLLCTALTAIGVIALILALIIPELIESITQLVNNYEYYLNNLLGMAQSIIDEMQLNVDISDVEKFTDLLENLFGSVSAAVTKILSSIQLGTEGEGLIGSVWSLVLNLFNTILDIVLGIFIAFYILSSKEKRKAQINKFRAAYFTDEQNVKITEIADLVNRTFSAYVRGVLLDALVVGVLMFIFLSLFRISEYALLIAAICAVTNIIPVFGPFIGAIPSALIVLITNPDKILWFILLVLLIQQIDGNIICPMIQGNNTGISSLAVLISITVMGGLFGIVGMIIGVPIFAVVIELCKRAIENRLSKQNKATDTTAYYPSNAVGNAEEEVYYEHSHWKYKYDHSRIKPHIDKLLARISGKRDQYDYKNDPDNRLE